MKIIDKINLLQEKHFGEWLKTRKEVDNELSDRQPMWCVCRKLATGFHQMGCRKFQGAVTRETVKRLSHLLK